MLSTKINRRSNFIRTHLIKEIFSRASKKKKICQVPENAFIYFNDPIQTSFYKINRIGKENFFFTNQTLPIDWSSIDGTILISALNQIKSNNFFVMKEISGKFYKTRINDRGDRK